MESGTLYIVATPIGNLGDISRRALDTLQEVDMIAAEDTRHTLTLLNHFGITKPLTSYFEHNKKEKGEYLISLLKEGKSIALVSDAGTPAISDPGEDLVRLCAENGIAVSPIPGACAAISALSVSGLVTGRFSFEGFLSVNKRARRLHLDEVKALRQTLIFYEAPHKLKSTLSDMLSAFGDRKITLARELTKLYEEIIRTTLKGAAALYENTAPRGEYVLIIEGAPETIAQGEDKWWNGLALTAHVEHYIKNGLDKKEAIKAAAIERGISKRDVYNEYNLAKRCLPPR